MAEPHQAETQQAETPQACHPQAGPLKIVVFDDDPTGSQTVHSCPLLLRWDAASLRQGLADPSPLLFLLVNSRDLAPDQARARLTTVCRTLKPLLAEAVAAGRIGRWLVVSRGDSTLRGHFPLESEVIAAELGPFDASFLVPAFLPGGRTTVEGVHLLHGEPVHRSAFAQDRLFGYGTSFLPAWIEEKTAGAIPAEAVPRIDRSALEAAVAEREGGGGDGFRALVGRLAAWSGNPWVVVDGERAAQLAAFAAGVHRVTAAGAGTAAEGHGPAVGEPPGETALEPMAGSTWAPESAPAFSPQARSTAEPRPRRFLFQSAASLITALAELPPQPLAPAGLAALRRRSPQGEPLAGLVMVGSHVPLADAQLAALLAEPACGGVELEVAKLARVLTGPLPDRLLPSLEGAWLERLHQVLARGQTPVLFTSRGELACSSPAERRALGEALAGLMARLAAQLAPQLGYLISKGGITSQTLLAQGLDLALVRLEGQLLPGLSLLRPAGDGVPEAWVGLPLITFPGNLGEASTLRESWRLMEGRGHCGNS
jgi:uncharacterized protein YgbK (DUF1537 family)